jgi:hypothetical protein
LGHRANFVVIKRGSAAAYHDQWAALGSTWAFAGGPDEAVSAAEGSQPTPELLDWAFAEAGYLIDFDRKRAVVFGYPEMGDFDLDEMADFSEEDVAAMAAAEAALQRGPLDFLQAIAPRWPGWHLHWDDRGVDAFAEYLAVRGIDSISTQPPSHPPDRSRISFQA